LRPAGGWLWAKVVKTVSTLSSILGRRPARDLSFKAKANPSVTNLRRMRMTVARLACKVWTISSSFLPWSANNKMLARLTFRAPGFPLRVSSIKVSFSSFVSSTMYCLAINRSFFWGYFLALF